MQNHDPYAAVREELLAIPGVADVEFPTINGVQAAKFTCTRGGITKYCAVALATNPYHVAEELDRAFAKGT